MIVVDASVAVKWLVSERDEDAAEELLKSEMEVAGPLLLRVEVTAAVARKARYREIPEAEAAAAIDLWAAILRGDIALFPEDDDLRCALDLSLELKHPLQDCIYLALAERLDAPLVTADEKFAAKARSRYSRVRLLTALRRS
jgi:predicted nucleic acid-binding protein